MNRRSTIERKFEAVLVAYSLTAEFFLSAGRPVDTEAAISPSAGLPISESPNERGLKVSLVFTAFFS